MNPQSVPSRTIVIEVAKKYLQKKPSDEIRQTDRVVGSDHATIVYMRPATGEIFAVYTRQHI